jgi:hypothetical protein
MIIGTLDLSDLSASEIIGWGCDAKTIRRCLELALNDCTEKSFRYIGPVPGLDCSVRVFGQNPFEGSVSLSRPINTEDLARELVRLARTEARYSPTEDFSRERGWTIHKSTDGDGNLFVAAYATWVAPS